MCKDPSSGSGLVAPLRLGVFAFCFYTSSTRCGNFFSGPLFEEVKDKVAGASSGCADVFGATEEVEKLGFELIKDNPVPGTSGLPSLRKLASEGYPVLTF